jgi:kynureninase
MKKIFEKQFLLTGFLEYLIKNYFSKNDGDTSITNESQLTVEIITPSNVNERGSQLSLKFSQDLKEVHEKVEQMGVVVNHQI